MTNKTKTAVGMGALDALDSFGDLSFSNLMEKSEAQPSGAALMVSIDLIEEDPNNIRVKFNLDESRATIRQRIEDGRPPIRTPVSIKKHPTLDGKWILNDGARRYRSAKLEGVEKLPCVVDENYDAYDKMLVNISRETHTPMEIATFIKLQIAAGDKKGDIAKRLGKPASFVSKHIVLNDMPAKIAHAYENDLCSDVEALYLLITNYSSFQSEFDQLIDAGDPIGQNKVKEIILNVQDASILQPAAVSPEATDDSAGNGLVLSDGKVAQNAAQGDTDGHEKTTTQSLEKEINQEPSRKKGQGASDDLEKIKRPVVQIEYQGREGRIVLSKRADFGSCWIKFDDSGEEIEVAIDAVKLSAIIDGN